MYYRWMGNNECQPRLRANRYIFNNICFDDNVQVDDNSSLQEMDQISQYYDQL